MAIYLLDRITKEGEDSGFLPGTLVKVTVPYRTGKEISVKCRCGFLLETNYKLTDLFCPNPYCFESNAYKVVKVFDKAHESINIGQKTAESIILHNGFKRHMDFFTISSPDQIPTQYSLERREEWVRGIREFTKDRTFAEFVEFFQIDGIGGTKCSYLFAGMSSSEDLAKAMESEYEFKLHISKVLSYSSAECEATLKVFQLLRVYLPLFQAYEPYFAPFQQKEGKVIFMSLTGSFSGFRPRSKLIDYITDNYNLSPVLVKYSSKSDILLYEEVNHSRQFDSAMKDGKAIHVDDFFSRIEYLRREPNEQ